MALSTIVVDVTMGFVLYGIILYLIVLTIYIANLKSVAIPYITRIAHIFFKIEKKNLFVCQNLC